jgi:hypothetical protein
LKQTLISILVLTSFSTYAQETTYIKNNQLCIKDVCIGDDVKDLKSIKLYPARTDIGDNRLLSSMKVSSHDVAKFLKIYMSSTTKSVNQEIVRYAWFKKFDNNAIDLLSKEKGFCKPIGELNAYYVTESGIKTSIDINIRVENNYTQQTWRVVRITQYFPADTTSAQRDQRFKVFLDRYKQRDPSNPWYGWNYSGGDLMLSEIDIGSGSRESNEDKLKKYPGCGTKLVAD